MKTLRWVLVVVALLLAGASANKCIAATCCCQDIYGRLCCAESSFCGYFIPGCFCAK